MPIAAVEDLSAALAQVELSMPAGTRIDVFLSGAFCPVIEVQYPSGLRSVAERETFASAMCAQKLGVDARDVIARVDLATPTIAAILLKEDRHALTSWSSKRAFKFDSLRPIWSLATHLSVSKSAAALAIAECDSVTVIGEDAATGTMRGLTTTIATTNAAASTIEELHRKLQFDATGIQVVRFGHEAAPGQALDARIWPGRWSRA